MHDFSLNINPLTHSLYYRQEWVTPPSSLKEVKENLNSVTENILATKEGFVSRIKNFLKGK